jgi:hypothetical protein
MKNLIGEFIKIRACLPQASFSTFTEANIYLFGKEKTRPNKANAVDGKSRSAD